MKVGRADMVSEVDSDPHAESSDTQITPGVLKANAAQYIECTVIEAQWRVGM